jgi:uncharacterized protein (DUF1499 family)
MIRIATASLLWVFAMSPAFAAGLQDGKLASCPDSPNCVSSDEQGKHAIAPFKLKVAAADAWEALERLLVETPRVKIVTRTQQYLHAEFTSTVLRFVDDVEFSLRPELGVIAVRSASRVGYYDFGANRSRVEDLRERLRKLEAIE